jgi:uncharacterized protein YbbC (DUF1343 family)
MVQSGLSVLLQEYVGKLAGRRVGLVSHAAAVLPDLRGILPALLDAGVKVCALFGAEHGIAGAAAAGAPVDSAVDPRSGLPVYSLYGAFKEPQAEMLANLDVLLVDFQDVGARFYTYLSTLFYVLRSAGRAGLPVMVLDRPNPLNGIQMEGPLVQSGFESFVGIAPIPVRHGMTLGELALWLNVESSLQADLTVVPLRGWARRMWFDQTGLPWVSPSPAMPHLSTAVLYPGLCFVEGTNLSEGRGTALPFEVVGAPWLDGPELAARLNRLDLPGVRFRPHSFVPAASKHAGQICAGVQAHVFDRGVFAPVRCGMAVLAACRAQGPDAFAFLPPEGGQGRAHFDLLAGSAQVRQHLQASGGVDEMVETWTADLERFARLRQSVLLYR